MTTTEVANLSPEHKMAAEQEARARRIVSMATAFVVDSDETFELAGEELVSIKTRIAAMDKQAETITKPAHAAWQAALALFKGPRMLLEQCEGIYKAKMLAYREEAKKKLALAQAHADEAAAASRKRLEAEAAKIKKAAEAAAKEGNTEAAGELFADAAAVAAEAAVVTAQPLAAAIPQAEGISFREKLEGRVRDKRAYFLFCAAQVCGSNNLKTALETLANMAPAEFKPVKDESYWLDLWVPDSRKLLTQVQAKGEHLGFPGVDVVKGGSVAARRG